MKAIQLEKHGDTEVLILKETLKPICQRGEIVVRVKAVGINYADTVVRQGNHRGIKDFPAIMPGEVEGIIEEVASDVHHLYPGQHITGFANHGYAQFAAISANQVTVLPEHLPIGKGMMIQHLTAQNLLHQVKHYESVLITAAAGGVGSSLTQIAKIRKVKTIIGLIGDHRKADYLRSLGCTDILIYTDDNWLDKLKKITHQRGVDLILESIGGEIGSELLPQLAPGGTLVVYGNSSGKLSPITLQSLIMPHTHILSARLYSVSEESKKRWTREVLEWLQSGELDVALTFYPLSEAAKAHQDLENRTSIGRLILNPW